MSKTAPQATGAPTRTPLPAVASLRVDPERLQRMWALTPAERLAAARRGQFTLGEMLRWAARRPQEVPLVAGEFFFIAALSADSESDDETATVRPNRCVTHARCTHSRAALTRLRSPSSNGGQDSTRARGGENFCLARLF